MHIVLKIETEQGYGYCYGCECKGGLELKEEFKLEFHLIIIYLFVICVEISSTLL